MNLKQPDCESVLSVLDSYADGSLTETEAKAISEHLEHCPSCQSEYRFQGFLRDGLREAIPDVPDTLHAKVMQDVYRDIEDSRLKKRLYWMRAVTGAAAAVLCFCLITVPILTGRFFRKSSQESVQQHPAQELLPENVSSEALNKEEDDSILKENVPGNVSGADLVIVYPLYTLSCSGDTVILIREGREYRGKAIYSGSGMTAIFVLENGQTATSEWDAKQGFLGGTLPWEAEP